MFSAVLAVAICTILLLGWASAPAAEPSSCPCVRCWYVSKPPEDAPCCPRVKRILIFAALSFVAFATLRGTKRASALENIERASNG